MSSAKNIKEQVVVREKPIPEIKKEIIKDLVDKISSSRTVLIASCKGLPGEQFHEIKKRLRDKAEIKVAKKSAINRAIDEIERGAVKNLKKRIEADIVILFSNSDAFELSALLADNKSPAKAKTGDIAPEDIKIEAGITELTPGPAISELGNVGLKVAVKEGKLEIIKGAVVAKKGEKISSRVASVLGKLNIKPIKVGFVPIAAYDSKEDKFYVDIVIDKEETLETLKTLIRKALGFAINVNYPTKETISYFIAKALAEEKALSKLIKKEASEEKTKEIDKSKNQDKKEDLNIQNNEQKKEQ